MNLDDFTMSGWPLVAWLLILLAIGMLIGAFFGRVARRSTFAAERRAGRDEGVIAGTETTWGLIGTDARRAAMAHMGLDTPRAPLFDQDEHAPLEPRPYVAPRVVSDDGEVLSCGSGHHRAGTLVIPRALLDEGHVEVIRYDRGAE